jgi:hypothetical protein
VPSKLINRPISRSDLESYVLQTGIFKKRMIKYVNEHGIERQREGEE